MATASPCFIALRRLSSVYPSSRKVFSRCWRPHAARSAARLCGAPAFFNSECVTITSICCGALVDELGGGVCMRRVRYQTYAPAASTATRRQLPSERPMAIATSKSFAPGGAQGGNVGVGGGGDGGGGEGASRMTWTWASITDGVPGASSMVMPNTLLIALMGFVCKANAADSTCPAVSVATTVRITLPAVTVTVSSHAGTMHCNSRRKLASTESALAS